MCSVEAKKFNQKVDIKSCLLEQFVPRLEGGTQMSDLETVIFVN